MNAHNSLIIQNNFESKSTNSSYHTMGFKRSGFDPCFHFNMDGDKILAIAVYVDFSLDSTYKKLVENVKNQLMTKLHMKALGETKQYCIIAHGPT